MAIRKLRIVGGPSLNDTHVFDAETGTEIYVRSIEFRWDARLEAERRCYVKIELPVQSLELNNVPNRSEP